MYYVYLVSSFDETIVFKSDDLEKAREEARYFDYCDKRDKNKGHTEIRLYTHDIEDEDCTCFDYEVIPF